MTEDETPDEEESKVQQDNKAFKTEAFVKFILRKFRETIKKNF